MVPSGWRQSSVWLLVQVPGVAGQQGQALPPSLCPPVLGSCGPDVPGTHSPHWPSVLWLKWL